MYNSRVDLQLEMKMFFGIEWTELGSLCIYMHRRIHLESKYLYTAPESVLVHVDSG